MAGVSDLVRQIVAGGALTDPAWRSAFAEVPREVFVPYYYVTLSGGGQERLWREDPDPERRRRWLQGVYDDVPLATRVRDGALVSSSSQPSLMAMMLESLDVRDGMRVLEIGTGTGYNAALLAHRLGDAQVTSVDLEPEVTEAARVHLAAAGYRPRVVTGDGALGAPAYAPYDRVIATCALGAVPGAWLEQCAPGALVLAPVGTGLVVLRVAGPRDAEGRFLPTPAYFVPLRGGWSGGGESGGAAGGPGRSTCGIPRHAQRHDSFHFLFGLAGHRVGPREAYELWRGAGRPARERYGVTVRGGAQWAWLDDPDGPHRWPLGAGSSGSTGAAGSAHR
ncbi:protein-L-isoaspartate(D-aspartate) O-methyltransferase [Streptomyces sp. Amel2xB2]|uniref:methyltransferase domain-containing protein n=1 Tax=Streptomyces sp. Amel2xB2 TaxID=1305829 RepID=UPI000DBA1BC0|nr:methyltransferase domain-containing protein [Streptomyces sp. Amel2xB2]RAJ69933.1 protein-L-isoaspartate(D-aspartate) O-methyltransferase [Streptomyces sp. Amel2xB2]